MQLRSPPRLIPTSDPRSSVLAQVNRTLEKENEEREIQEKSRIHNIGREGERKQEKMDNSRVE